MAWVSLGDAASLAVQRVIQARKRRAACGRQVAGLGGFQPWGTEGGYDIHEMRLLIVSDIVVSETEAA